MKVSAEPHERGVKLTIKVGLREMAQAIKIGHLLQRYGVSIQDIGVKGRTFTVIVPTSLTPDQLTREVKHALPKRKLA